MTAPAIREYLKAVAGGAADATNADLVARFTGYIPLGGFIPQLVPGADGEAVGYKRYNGAVVAPKKLLDDYSEAMRSF